MPRTRAMMCCTCAPLLLLLLLLLERGSVCVAQECDTNTPFSLYRSSPPSPYNGIVAIITANCNVNLVCGSSTVLADSTTTPTESLDLSDPNYVRNFATYNSSLSPYIVFEFRFAVQLSRVDLYFLHYPALNIGLPNFKMFEVSGLFDESGGTTIPYTLGNNQNLDSGDRQVQRVTLLFNTGSITRQHFRLDMSFSDLYNTEWFFLSGIRFCNRSPQHLPSGAITPETASTNVTATTQELDLGLIDLTCTVSSSGSLEWQWMRAGSTSPLEGGKYTVTTALGGRMSVLTISQLSAEDRGVYQCAVCRLGFASAAMATKEIVLIIPEEPSTTQTLMPENTTQSLTTESSEDRKPCDTAIALAVVLTLLAAAAVSALIHVAVCICLHQKRAKRDEPAVHDYEMPVQKPCDRAGEDVVYDVIAGEGTERVAMPMDKNKAYGHFN